MNRRISGSSITNHTHTSLRQLQSDGQSVGISGASDGALFEWRALVAAVRQERTRHVAESNNRASHRYRARGGGVQHRARRSSRRKFGRELHRKRDERYASLLSNWTSSRFIDSMSFRVSN